MTIPDGWLDYKPIGEIIEGTRIIAFKVPLRKCVNENEKISREHQLYPKLLLEKYPKLGLIVDLTYTYRYYSPDEFTDRGVQYLKIMVPGHIIPSNDLIEQFNDGVLEYLNSSESDKLIGVHCTHGVNRTGFFIASHLVKNGARAKAAIKRVEIARGHKIKRKNYIDEIYNIEKRIRGTDKKLDTDKLDSSFAPTSTRSNEKEHRNERSHSPKSSSKNQKPVKRSENRIVQSTSKAHNPEEHCEKNLNSTSTINKQSTVKQKRHSESTLTKDHSTEKHKTKSQLSSDGRKFDKRKNNFESTLSSSTHTNPESGTSKMINKDKKIVI